MEDIYQALLTKEIKSTQDFFKWYKYIEDIKQKKTGGRKVDRLPNEFFVAALDEELNLISLIVQIVREVQRLVALQGQNTDPEVQTVED